MTAPLSVPLVVPVIDADASTLDAALAYAGAGFYVGPVERGTKHPGSVLGPQWQHRTSRDPKMIASWFAGTEDGVFLHAGRSGCVIFDVDDPSKLHPMISVAVESLNPPFQSTRVAERGRGHYVFRQPEGRSIGNSLGTLGGGWGEVRGVNGVIIVAPSEHEKLAEGGRYLWELAGLVPVLPPEVAAKLPDALDAAFSATDAQVVAFLAEHDADERAELLDVHVRAFRSACENGESRHGTMCGHLVGAMKEAAAGLLDAREAAGRLESVFLEAVAQEPTGKQGSLRRGALAVNEWRGLLSWAVAQARVADPVETRARSAERVPDLGWPVAGVPGRTSAPVKPRPFDDRRKALGDLLADLRTWQHLPDPTHVVAVLAAAATRRGDGEPCWLMLVAPPSSGKTETVRMLDQAADAQLDDVTCAGLLGWSRGKPPKPTGVLTRVGANALVTFGDLSSLLSTSDRGGRDQVFALLRRAYDGHVVRDIQMAGGAATDAQNLEWRGRLTVVACVTQMIDRYSSHADQLGPRWIYVRLPERTTGERRMAAQLARRQGLAAHRKQAKVAAAELLSLVTDLPPLPAHVADAIEDAALVAAWGRGVVPRHGYGRREIEGLPVVEEPMRLVQQLGALARGVLALGLPDVAATMIARRAALDSMPSTRRALLAALATGEVMSTAACARAADGMDRKLARMTLDELAVIGVVENDRAEHVGDDDVIDRGLVNWRLSGPDGVLIADVFYAHRTEGGWGEMWVYTSISPPEEGGEGTSSSLNPTLLPTPLDGLIDRKIA